MNGSRILPRILLVVGGGIAAYKSCELVRLIRKAGGEVTCVLTDGGAKFVTPLALAALSENPVHTTLWDLKNEVEMGHIQLSRQADLVVVCPATADLLAKMAAGIADDLATTLLLATDKPVMAVPAMNVRMWQHAATVRNVATLRDAGVEVMEPDEGPMACGEFGPGRLPEPEAIWRRIADSLDIGHGLALAALAPSRPFAEPEEAVAEDLVEDGEGESDLPGLSASLILRSKEPVAFDPPVIDEAFSLALAPEETPPPLDMGGPLLSKKGQARAAPPTDAQAVNHLGGHAAPPEPFAEEAPGATAGALADPLSGQPDFEAEPAHRPLYGRHVLITAGPTHEPIDPVRYIANRSSGKQGFAIAAAAAELGARVTLVAGPVNLPTPPGVDRWDVETAREMAEAVKRALPADVAVMVAAVADWRTTNFADEKIKKRGSAPPALLLTENPDILGMVSGSPQRPKLLIGFAAETENVLDNATEKRKRKAADWIVANDVSGDVMGGAANTVHIVSAAGIESLPEMPKEEVARAIVERIADALG
jgi:phosphopantothenoylcysteine decarboxylase/phosphopantothenate--cysteine ligase